MRLLTVCITLLKLSTAQTPPVLSSDDEDFLKKWPSGDQCPKSGKNIDYSHFVITRTNTRTEKARHSLIECFFVTLPNPKFNLTRALSGRPLCQNGEYAGREVGWGFSK